MLLLGGVGDAVLPHFKEAQVPTDSINTVTLAVQLSVDRIDRLLEVAERWQGPVSAAVLLRNKQDMSVVEAVWQASSHARSRVSVHLVWTFRDCYPVNALRNVAIKNAGTNWVLMLDVDYLPSQDAYSLLNRYTNNAVVSPPLNLVDSHATVLILPAFELSEEIQDLPLPATKEEVAKLFSSKAASIPHQGSELHGTSHLPTNYHGWFSSSKPFEAHYAYMYEPFVVFDTRYTGSTPYDEIFCGYGGDKASFTLELARAGMHFAVLPDVFVVRPLWSQSVSPPILTWKKDSTSEWYRRWFIFEDSLQRVYGHPVHPCIFKPAEALQITRVHDMAAAVAALEKSDAGLASDDIDKDDFDSSSELGSDSGSSHHHHTLSARQFAQRLDATTAFTNTLRRSHVDAFHAGSTDLSYCAINDHGHGQFLQTPADQAAQANGKSQHRAGSGASSGIRRVISLGLTTVKWGTYAVLFVIVMFVVSGWVSKPLGSCLGLDIERRRYQVRAACRRFYGALIRRKRRTQRLGSEILASPLSSPVLMGMVAGGPVGRTVKPTRCQRIKYVCLLGFLTISACIAVVGAILAVTLFLNPSLPEPTPAGNAEARHDATEDGAPQQSMVSGLMTRVDQLIRGYNGHHGPSPLRSTSRHSEMMFEMRPPKESMRPSCRDSGITLFAIPKAMNQDEALNNLRDAQFNAILSWTKLRPRPEIILFGDAPGVSEIARELHVRHEPTVRTNEFGTPLIDDLFLQAQRLSSHPTMLFVNSDVTLLSSLGRAFQVVCKSVPRDSRYLIIGKRTSLRVDGKLDFTDSKWEQKLHTKLAATTPDDPRAVDYFMFNRGLWPSIPPFAVGRMAWDTYLVHTAIKTGAFVIDASLVTSVAHWTHSYSHIGGVQTGGSIFDARPGTIGYTELDRNYCLAGLACQSDPKRVPTVLMGATTHAAWEIRPCDLQMEERKHTEHDDEGALAAVKARLHNPAERSSSSDSSAQDAAQAAHFDATIQEESVPWCMYKRTPCPQSNARGACNNLRLQWVPA